MEGEEGQRIVQYLPSVHVSLHHEGAVQRIADLVVGISFQYLCTNFNALFKSPAAEEAVGHVERVPVHLCPTQKRRDVLFKRHPRFCF